MNIIFKKTNNMMNHGWVVMTVIAFLYYDYLCFSAGEVIEQCTENCVSHLQYNH
jgi:hypothetical protein